MTIIATAQVPGTSRLNDVPTERLMSTSRLVGDPGWCTRNHSGDPDDFHQSPTEEFTASDPGAYEAPATAMVWLESVDDVDGVPSILPRLVLTLREGDEGGFPSEPDTVGWTGTPEQAEALAAALMHAARVVRATRGAR